MPSTYIALTSPVHGQQAGLVQIQIPRLGIDDIASLRESRTHRAAWKYLLQPSCRCWAGAAGHREQRVSARRPVSHDIVYLASSSMQRCQSHKGTFELRIVCISLLQRRDDCTVAAGRLTVRRVVQVAKANVLMVGAGGIGCELIKTLVLTGFRKITMVRTCRTARSSRSCQAQSTV